MTVYVGAIERDVVTIAGSEAAAYLQGQISQDVHALGLGDSAWTFVLSPQGKVDGWGRVHRVDAETYELDVDAGAGAGVVARLQRFLLRTKAEVTMQESVPGVAVRGADPAGALPIAATGGAGGDLLRAKVGDLPAEVTDGAEEVDEAGLEARRVQDGIPAWGHEIDHGTIPATLGQRVIEASVSFTKGCYTGQELVARIDSRGGNVPRRLCGFTSAGPALGRGEAVVVDGKEVGVVTTGALDPTTGRPIGLAFVQRSVEVPADAIVDGTAVRLVPLPIDSADA